MIFIPITEIRHTTLALFLLVCKQFGTEIFVEKCFALLYASLEISPHRVPSFWSISYGIDKLSQGAKISLMLS